MAKAAAKKNLDSIKVRDKSKSDKKKRRTGSRPGDDKKVRAKKVKPLETDAKNAALLEFNRRLSDVYAKRLDAVEKQFAITSSGLNIPDRLSTGMLCYDIVSGGGLVGGTMVQVSGKEKAGKSTACLSVVASAINNHVPIINYWDAENALSDPDYAKGVMRLDPAEIFYGKNRVARLYQEAVLEDFYNATRSIMRRVPDKYYKHEEKEWFFVFDNTKEARAMLADFGYKNESYSKALFQETGRLWVPTAPGLQGVVFCDSYPALSSASDEDEEEGSKGMALDARGFSKNIKRIKGILKRKAFLVFGVNQIRLNPGARNTNPEYEPGGEALKFYSDVRMQQRGRAVPEPWGKGIKPDGGSTNEFGSEKSVTGKGHDNYTYVYLQNTKNKTDTPYRASWMRIWFSDAEGKAHGYDPVFDTFNYLKMTGRVSGNKKGYKFDFGKLKGRPTTFLEFKLLVLAEFFGKKELKRRVTDELGMEPFAIRAQCFKEIQSRAAFGMLSKIDKDTDEADSED